MLINTFQDLFKKYKYSFDDRINIFGVRTSNKATNLFDDYLFCIFRDNAGKWVIKQWAATTDPGYTSLQKPMNAKGTAILAPGQYVDAYQIGLHRNRYEALVQRKPVKVYRDSNRNLEYDFNPSSIDTGIFGINIHKAGDNSHIVNNWSAGCQVFKRVADFNEFMSIVKKHARTDKNQFTYTLFLEPQFIS